MTDLHNFCPFFQFRHDSDGGGMKGLEYSMWREYSPHIAGQNNSIFLLVLAVILVFLFQERCECNMQEPVGDARRLIEKDGTRKAEPKSRRAESETGKGGQYKALR